MIDHGSQGNLIDREYAEALHLQLVERADPVPIEGFDGARSDEAMRYHTEPVDLRIGDHRELIELNLSSTSPPSNHPDPAPIKSTRQESPRPSRRS